MKTVTQGTAKVKPIAITCDCCEKEGLGFVVAGPGPMSTARCQECINAGVEPLWGLVAYTYTMPWDDIAPEYQEHIRYCYTYFGKAIEDYHSDVEKAFKDMEDYFNNLPPGPIEDVPF